MCSQITRVHSSIANDGPRSRGTVAFARSEEEVHETHNFGPACGSSVRDCHFLGARENAQSELEGTVFRRLGDQTTAVYRFDGPMADLCRLPGGEVYLTLADGKLIAGSADGASWERATTPFAAGVWGLDADRVFAWRGKELYTRSDAGWITSQAPLRVHAMHGCDKDHIYAAGSVGLAKLEGSELVPVETGIARPVYSLFVAGAAEIYALSMNHELWRGGSSGWEKWTKLPMGTRCIAKWNGQLWFGHERLGIGVVGEDGTYQWRKMDVAACGFDACGDLLIQTSRELLSTGDGESFDAMGIEVLEAAFAPWKAKAAAGGRKATAAQAELLARLLKHTGLSRDVGSSLLHELYAEGGRPTHARITKALRKRQLRDEANRYKYCATVERLVEETGKPFAECQAATIEAKGSIRKARVALEG